MKTLLKSPTVISKKKLKSIRSKVAVAHGDYKSALLKRALYKTNDSEVSQDLVQTTFLKTMVYLRRGGEIEIMRGFLNHVLNGLIVDGYRKNDKIKMISLDVLLERGFDPASNDYQRVTDIIDGKELASLIPQLTKKYGVVLEMRYLKGLSLKEIALLTGQSENTVAVQIHRGLAKLKKLYLKA